MISISEHFTYRKLLLFSFPSVVSMIFTSLYTIIDGIFVANYAGSLPFAAINLIWPPLGIIQALGFMIGAGGSALVSRLLGQHEHEKAKRVFTMLIAFSAVLGVVCNGLFLFFVEPIARFLGADATLLPDCIIYGRVLAWFMGFCMVSSTFQAFLITVSKARLALIFNLICGGLNILLDQLLVGNLHLGVYGAGYATGLNWLLAALLPIAFFIKNPTLSYTRFHWDFRALFETCSNGISEMISNVSISLIAALYNYALISWIGSDGVIAFGIIQYIGFVFAALFLGYGSALIPVIGYHFGDGNDRELLGILKRSLILIAGFSVLLFGISELSADFLAAVFVHDEPELFGYRFMPSGSTRSAFFCLASTSSRAVSLPD